MKYIAISNQLNSIIPHYSTTPMLPRKLLNDLPKPLVVLLAIYFLSSLGHYTVAPMAYHKQGANVTILSKVAAAAVLLTCAVSVGSS